MVPSADRIIDIQKNSCRKIEKINQPQMASPGLMGIEK